MINTSAMQMTDIPLQIKKMETSRNTQFNQ